MNGVSHPVDTNTTTLETPAPLPGWRAFTPEGREFVVYAATVHEALDKFKGAPAAIDPSSIELDPRPRFISKDQIIENYPAPKR